MSWSIVVVARFTDGSEELLTLKEQTALMRAESPLDFMKELGETRGKEFKNLNVNLSKSGDIDQKDVKKLLELARAVRTNHP